MGGDSLFVGLSIVINKLPLDRLPMTVDGLRALLVEELLAYSDKFNLKIKP